METVQYSSWVELFRSTCIVYNVLDHSDSTAPRPSDIDTPLWMRLDAMVKQWLYATISPDLLQTILKPNATAHEVWTRVEELFHDNKNTRAVFLETQFNKLALYDFPNASSYCQQIKLLADQLANLGQPISAHKMVLRLVAGLPKAYDTVATMIQQSDPLPNFYHACSKLLLEEPRKAQQKIVVANLVKISAN